MNRFDCIHYSFTDDADSCSASHPWPVFLLLFFYWLARGRKSRRTSTLLHYHPTPHPLLHPVLWGEPVGEHQTTGYVEDKNPPIYHLCAVNSLLFQHFLCSPLLPVKSESIVLFSTKGGVVWETEGKLVWQWEEKGSVCPLLSCRRCWMCSHSSFFLLALNVGWLIENKWRADKEPSTMAAGTALTRRTAVG